jgi:Alpha galactosidase C-terminal beta sandwich domain
MRVGRISLQDAQMVCLFNWSDAPESLAVRLPRPVRVTDVWTGESRGRTEALSFPAMPPHSARLLVCR